MPVPVSNSGPTPSLPSQFSPPSFPLLPATVPQTFSVNNVSLLQYFGGTENGDCVINNTSVNSLMVAGGTSPTTGKATLIGGYGWNELLGGDGNTVLIGRGSTAAAATDYLLANCTVNYANVLVGHNGTVRRLRVSPANYDYIYDLTANLVYASGPGNNNVKTVIDVFGKSGTFLGSGVGLTPLEWLEGQFWSTGNIIKAANTAMLELLPACPGGETNFT